MSDRMNPGGQLVLPTGFKEEDVWTVVAYLASLVEEDRKANPEHTRFSLLMRVTEGDYKGNEYRVTITRTEPSTEVQDER